MDKAFADLAAQLHQMGGDVMRKAQRKGLKKVGEIFQAAISTAAPEKTEQGGILKPGELKASIKARVRIASDEQIVGGSFSRVIIGPNTHEAQLVANWVENGHAPRPASAKTKNKRQRRTFVDAHPFVRPTYDATVAEAEAAYIESVTDDLQKAMK